MFGKFFTRRKPARPKAKAAAKRKPKSARTTTLSELEEQIVGPVRALEETAGIDRQSPAEDKQKLIQEALRIQRQKQAVFADLSPEKRQALRLMAEQMLIGGKADGEDQND